MTTLITGAGLVGTSYAQQAVRRGEKVVFVDPIPREDFIRRKLGNADFTYLNEDVRSLPGLIATINEYEVDTILNTASVIGKKVNDPITVQVISSDNKGLIVKPEGTELKFLIKKSQIAVSAADARPSRFVGGERIDTAIAELNLEKRKVNLSIKLLEELQNKEAVTKFSSPLSGKNLPFSSLSEQLDDKKNKKD